MITDRTRKQAAYDVELRCGHQFRVTLEGDDHALKTHYCAECGIPRRVRQQRLVRDDTGGR